MKKVKTFLNTLTVICLFTATACGQSVTNNDTSMYYKLVTMKFENYIGKELSLFLNDFNPDYKEDTPMFLKPGYVSYVGFTYGDSIWLVVNVKGLGQDVPMPKYIFDIELYKSKKVEQICFRYAGLCIKGCEKQRCPWN